MLKFIKVEDSEGEFKNSDTVIIKHVNGSVYPCRVYTFKTRKPKYKLLDCHYTLYIPHSDVKEIALLRRPKDWYGTL